MILYLVERYGVYSQGIYGVFDDHTDALDALREAKAKEGDDYHNFCINSRILSKRGYDDESTEQVG